MTVAFHYFGRSVHITGDDSSSITYLTWLFADAVHLGRGDGGVGGAPLSLVVRARQDGWCVEDGERALPCSTLPAVGDVLLRRCHTHVREHSTALMLHAGAVAGPRGAVVLFGRSGAGKSSLVAECVRRGADHLADELVAFDGEGSILSAGMPLNMKAGGRGLLRWVDHDGPVPPGAVRRGSAVATARPMAIVGLSAHDGVGLHPITRRDAVLAMVQVSTLNGPPGDRGLAAFSEIVDGIDTATLGRADVGRNAHTILTLLGLPSGTV